VGQAFGTVDGDTIAGAYVWTNGTIRSLGSLGGQPGNTMAFAINDRGEITGQSQTASEEYHAFQWRRGTIINIGTLPVGGNSVGLDVNNRGEIVALGETVTLQKDEEG
jgi:probable HAF family extracellular repeat protein